jgi:hypothetical protein
LSWPDDGTCYVRVVGRKGTTEKEKLLTLTIQGHILGRTVIRTYRW